MSKCFVILKKKILYLQYKPAPVKKVSPVTSTSSVSSSRLPQRPAYGQGGGTGTDRISELNCKAFPKSLQAALAHLISCSVKACSNMIQDLIFWYHQQLHSWQYWMCEKTDPGTFFFFSPVVMVTSTRPLSSSDVFTNRKSSVFSICLYKLYRDCHIHSLNTQN